MASRSSLRASDADRDQVADRLRKAAAEGRILAEELEERVAAALRSKTYGELDAVTADLPGGRIAHNPYPRRPITREPLAIAAMGVTVALVGVILAALIVAGLVAASGVWIFFAFFWIARGGPRRRRIDRGRGGGYGPGPYRNLPSRW